MRLNSKITPDRLAAIAVTLLPLLYFLPATRGDLVISPDDGLIFNIPIRVAVANLLHAGHLPLWTPDIFCGMPLFGAAQAGVLFPLNWFYLAFSAPVATNLMMLSSYMVAALGAYLFARRSGSSVPGAALTSLIWQGSGFLIGQIGHTNILHTAALLPWVLWAIDGYGRERETKSRSFARRARCRAGVCRPSANIGLRASFRGGLRGGDVARAGGGTANRRNRARRIFVRSFSSPPGWSWQRCKSCR